MLPITTERLAEFLSLVQDTRHLQRYARRTMDSIAKRELPRLEESLDAELSAIVADLADVPEFAAVYAADQARRVAEASAVREKVRQQQQAAAEKGGG